MKIKILFLIGLVFVSFGCKRKSGDSNTNSGISVKLHEVSVRQEWFPNSNYCGAVFAKEIFAEKNNISINIVAGADNIDPIKLVISGQNDFSDAGADRVVEAIGKGADIVIIGVVNLISPTCFLSKKEKNIETPKDFEGKRVGILSGTNTEYIYKALVEKLDLNKNKIIELEIPFDLSTFILDKYDVRPAFMYDEPISLDLKNIKYNLIEPKNYGISFMGTVYFTRRNLINQHPEYVQSFINSVADGWKATLKYPELAIKYLKQNYPEIDETRELNALIKGKEYFKGKDGKILWADYDDWNEMLSILKSLGKIKKIDLKKYINNTFLENYYKSIEMKNIKQDKI